MPTNPTPINRPMPPLPGTVRLAIRLAACSLLIVTALGVSEGSPKTAGRQTAVSKQVLLTVNGNPITRGDLEFLLLTRGIGKDLRPKLRKQFLNRLIDRRLVQAFLEARHLKASSVLVDAHIERIKRFIRKNGDDPKTVFARLGYNEQTLRRELSLPLAWRFWIRRTVTSKRLRDEFAAHHQEFDGTRVRASQIFLKLRAEVTPADIKAAQDTLTGIRAKILAKRITFAVAAKQFSQAPSRQSGGDVGFFPYRGRMPADFSRRAFSLKIGEVSQPFRSRFGMHLITVTARKPGRLSLEDVRDQVLDRIAETEWTKLVAAQRKSAKIVWEASAEGG